MTKDDALRQFGEIGTPEERAAAITALTTHLRISRQAFYLWDDAAIPKRREYEVQAYAAGRAANETLARTRAAVEQGGGQSLS